jgi:hypothetical protein
MLGKEQVVLKSLQGISRRVLRACPGFLKKYKGIPLIGALLAGLLTFTFLFLQEHYKIFPGEGGLMLIPFVVLGMGVALFLDALSLGYGSQFLFTICCISANMVVVWCLLYLACIVLGGFPAPQPERGKHE